MALPKRLADILRLKNERLESVPDAFTSAMVQAQKGILAELIEALGTLDRDGQFITLSSANLIRVEEISNLLEQLFTSQSDYVEAVTALAGEFDEQALLSDSYFQELDVDFTVPTIAEEVFLTRKANALDMFLGDGVKGNVSARIRQQIVSAVTSGASYSDTLTSLRELIEGSDGKDGLLVRYSRQITSDAFAITDRSYTDVIREERGYEWFLYSGGLMDSTRCFCKHRNGKFFHLKEIQDWGNGKGIGICLSKGGLWDGAFDGTNSQNVFVYAGGYNCAHSIQPVSVFAVPKSDVERNIANGNYEPSAVELDLLTN